MGQVDAAFRQSWVRPACSMILADVDSAPALKDNVLPPVSAMIKFGYGALSESSLH